MSFAKWFKYIPDRWQLFNAWHDAALPPRLIQHELVQSALSGVDLEQLWDGHVHVLGLGDTDSGIWVNPRSQQWWHVWRYTQFRFFLNACCVTSHEPLDNAFVHRLRALQWASGVRFLLLAFDYSYDERGRRLEAYTPFYVPNHYVANLHQTYPETFEWLASIHPYRADCIEALEQAAQQGARGVKWLPPAQGMNPDSPLCDRFYQALVRLNLPLLCHGGHEHSVSGMQTQAYGNPLLLRRALEWGVRVVIAHCACRGNSVDSEHRQRTRKVRNFVLFTRLLNEPRYQGLLWGDISAITQTACVDSVLDSLLAHPEWHSRLLYASDYPIPAVIPLFSLRWLVYKRYITPTQAQVLDELRYYNPLLFDVVLKRQVQSHHQFFHPTVFHTRAFWQCL